MRSKNNFGDDPLLTAVLNNKLEFVWYLIESNLYTLASFDAEKNNALIIAVANDFWDLAGYIISRNN